MNAGVGECPNSFFGAEVRRLVHRWHQWTISGVLPYGVDTVGDMPQWMVEVFSTCEGAVRAADGAERRAMNDRLNQLMASRTRRPEVDPDGWA